MKKNIINDGCNLIKLERERKDISISLLSKCIGISEEEYAYFEEHIKESDAYLCLQICAFLGVEFNRI